MTIGVAKPNEQELAAVKHYFINSHSIQEEVTAATYEQYALSAANEIFKDNDIAIVVGGTGLYIKAFCEGLDAIPAIDPLIRQAIINDYELKGLEWLQQQVKEYDPVYYKDGEVLNPQRLMRALEVKQSTGESIRTFQQGTKANRDFAIIKIGLELPKEQLHAQIDQRVDEMMRQGQLEEVKLLYPYRKLTALQTVGYKELFSFIDEEQTLVSSVDLIKKNTRHYAKRQVTWFKKSGIDHFFHPRNINDIILFVENKLQ